MLAWSNRARVRADGGMVAIAPRQITRQIFFDGDFGLQLGIECQISDAKTPRIAQHLSENSDFLIRTRQKAELWKRRPAAWIFNRAETALPHGSATRLCHRVKAARQCAN